MGWEKNVGIGTVILLVIITIVIVVIFVEKDKNRKKNILQEKYKRGDTSVASGVASGVASDSDKLIRDGTFFYIHNHLKKTIRVKCIIYENPDNEVTPKSLDSMEFKFDIPPLSKKGLSEEFAKIIFATPKGVDGTKVKAYTLDVGLTPAYPSVEQFFAEYKMKTPGGTMIKELHIGMVTSKVLGERYNQDVIAVGSAQGRGRVHIHNLTDRKLRLNYNIIIPPHDTLIYYGQNYIGVNLGTIFKDQDGLYEDFNYKMPATDIIYGLSSDVEFGKFAGFENDIRGLLNIPHEPMWLLAEGYLSGPAFSRIDPFFIPTEGKPISPVDQWGRNINKPSFIKEDSHIDNRKPYKLPGNLHIV
jgi:hypothetical protein